MLPKKAIEEFKRIYKKNYGIELTNEEAIKRANNLVALYEAVYGNDSGRLEDNKSKDGYDTTTLSYQKRYGN
ncbi:MAG: hypothetical protein AAB340_00290 [Patescibacteria group bacterium]